MIARFYTKDGRPHVTLWEEGVGGAGFIFPQGKNKI